MTRTVYRSASTTPMIRIGLFVMIGLIVGLTCRINGQTDDRLRRLINGAGGVVLPNVPLPNDLVIKSRKATTWESGGTHRIVLEGDTAIAIGSYGFRADNAVIFVTELEAPGLRAHQLEIYLDQVREIGGHRAIQTRAKRLLVTGIISGKIRLDADRLVEEKLDTELVAAATKRVNRFHANLRNNVVALRNPQPTDTAAALAERARRQTDVRGQFVKPVEIVEGTTPGDTVPIEPTPGDLTPTEPTEEPTTTTRELASGRVFFNAGKIVYQEDNEESYALLIGDVTVMYYDPRTRQSLSLSADKAVIFTEPGGITGQTQTNAQVVRGIYLEDDVIATNGEYTIRGPRVFYDLQTDRAIVLEAVFYTWSIGKQVPLYLRAAKLMQVTQNQWQAEQATLSTSEFAEPHFSIGAEKLTIHQTEEGGVEPTRRFDARGMKGQVAGLPVFWWPRVKGKMADSPLERVQVDFNDREGVAVRTRWDAFALAGTDAPDGVSLKVLADYYSKRGPAAGVDLQYDVPRAFGTFDAMGLYDYGDDEPGGRLETEPEDEFRGLAHLQHRHYLSDSWEASLEISYISDPTYLEEFFTNEAYADKPWETSLYLKNQQDDWAFTFLVKYDLLDFVPQATQLQTPGYTVDKLPEVSYYRVGTSLLDDSITWFSENRASLVRFNFPEQAPRALGYTFAEAVALYGISNATPFDKAFLAAGYEDDTIWRVDTRQEFALPLKIGPIDVVPYIVGRVTGYEEDHNSFAGNDENFRFWGQGGVKIHTAITRTYDRAQSKLFDINRIRHIIEPSVHATFAWTNVDQDVLPVYDYDVESLAEGGTVRLGLRNTFQTQRGMEGNWRSVDVLRIDTDFVIQDDKTARESPIARFFDYRPEYSLAGDHFWTEMAWQVTDALSTVANLTYSFDDSEVEQWNWGLQYDHNPRLTSFMTIRRIDHRDSTILRYGFDYLLSSKYHLSLSQSLDLERNNNRSINFRITRRFPRVLVMLAFSYDEVGDITSVGLALVPEGVPGRGNPENNPFITAY
jgi:hypothetical protein